MTGGGVDDTRPTNICRTPAPISPARRADLASSAEAGDLAGVRSLELIQAARRRGGAVCVLFSGPASAGFFLFPGRPGV